MLLQVEALQDLIVVADSQACGQETEHQEGLCAGLVLDIVLDRVWDEVLDLEEDLKTTNNKMMLFR